MHPGKLLNTCLDTCWLLFLHYMLNPFLSTFLQIKRNKRSPGSLCLNSLSYPPVCCRDPCDLKRSRSHTRAHANGRCVLRQPVRRDQYIIPPVTSLRLSTSSSPFPSHDYSSSLTSPSRSIPRSIPGRV